MCLIACLCVWLGISGFWGEKGVLVIFRPRGIFVIWGAREFSNFRRKIILVFEVNSYFTKLVVIWSNYFKIVK